MQSLSFFKRREGGGQKKVQTSEGIASHKGHNILHNNLQENQKIPPADSSKLSSDSWLW